MKFHALMLLSTFSFLSMPAMLRRSSPVIRPPLRPAAPRKTPIQTEIEKLKAQRDAAEHEAHKARLNAQYWKDVAQHCKRNGCTQACLSHLNQKCNQTAQQQRQDALQKFYKHQALDQRTSERQQLKPRAQK
jgi:hypothetical protein